MSLPSTPRLFAWATPVLVSALALGCGKRDFDQPSAEANLVSAIRSAKTSAGPVAEEKVAFNGTYGSLKGVFKYSGAPPNLPNLPVTKDVEVCGKNPIPDESIVVGADSGLANVVVYVTTKNVPGHPSYETKESMKGSVVLDNKGCYFRPHILPIRLSQTLVVKNSDDMAHNSNIAPPRDRAFNPTIPGHSEATHQFERVQRAPFSVVCNMHGWMKAYIFPSENPYVAVTDDKGEFHLENLPAGIELSFQVWHEKSQGLAAKPEWKKGRFTLTLNEGDENDLGTIEVSADQLQ